MAVSSLGLEFPADFPKNISSTALFSLNLQNTVFPLRLLEDEAFKEVRRLKVVNGCLDGDLFTYLKRYETVYYRHDERNKSLDNSFPYRVRRFLEQIAAAPRMEHLEKFTFCYTHLEGQPFEETLIPELHNLHHKILYYAKIKDPTGYKEYKSIYCLAVLLSEHNDSILTMEKLEDDLVTLHCTIIPKTRSALEVTILLLFEKIFHQVFGGERVFDYSGMFEKLMYQLDLNDYRPIIQREALRFMENYVVPCPVYGPMPVFNFPLFRDALQSVFFQVSDKEEDPQKTPPATPPPTSQ